MFRQRGIEPRRHGSDSFTNDGCYVPSWNADLLAYDSYGRAMYD